MLRVLAVMVLAGCSITAEEAQGYPSGPYALERGAVLPDLVAPGVHPVRGRMEIAVSNVRAELPECRCLVVHVARPGGATSADAREKLRGLRLEDPTMCAVEVLAEAEVADLPAISDLVAPTMLAPVAVTAVMNEKFPEGFDLAVRTDTMTVKGVTVGTLDLATMREACGTWPRHS